MLKLGINYCDCSGLMSVCKACNDTVNQQFCDFAPGDGNDCMFLRKDLGNHCDNPTAQYESRHGKTIIQTEQLPEEDISDLKHKEEYPEYKDEGCDLYL